MRILLFLSCYLVTNLVLPNGRISIFSRRGNKAGGKKGTRDGEEKVRGSRKSEDRNWLNKSQVEIRSLWTKYFLHHVQSFIDDGKRW